MPCGTACVRRESSRTLPTQPIHACIHALALTALPVTHAVAAAAVGVAVGTGGSPPRRRASARPGALAVALLGTRTREMLLLLLRRPGPARQRPLYDAAPRNGQRLHAHRGLPLVARRRRLMRRRRRARRSCGALGRVGLQQPPAGCAGCGARALHVAAAAGAAAEGAAVLCGRVGRAAAAAGTQGVLASAVAAAAGHHSATPHLVLHKGRNGSMRVAAAGRWSLRRPSLADGAPPAPRRPVCIACRRPARRPLRRAGRTARCPRRRSRFWFRSRGSRIRGGGPLGDAGHCSSRAEHVAGRRLHTANGAGAGDMVIELAEVGARPLEPLARAPAKGCKVPAQGPGKDNAKDGR